MRRILTIALVLLAGTAFAASDRSEDGLWQLAALDESLPVLVAHPAAKAAVAALDNPTLERLLARAPKEGSLEASVWPAVITLPLADGRFQAFAVIETVILGPEMQAAHPEIHTYAGYGLDDATARIRLDVTSTGFHGQILSTSGTTYIDPAGHDRYVIYDKGSAGPIADYRCRLGDADHPVSEYTADHHYSRRGLEPAAIPPSPTSLRPYRTVVSATSGYAAFHGGQAGAEAAIVSMINRVNGIYERDLSVRLVLVRSLVYADAATDPFAGMTGEQAYEKNQSVTDGAVGSGNYDVGHVVGTNGSGGLAALGGVCDKTAKALGMTFLERPTGDGFVVDYVAHEFGHQFGANHSYNSSSGGACTTRETATAMEPGSGSTIMGYTNICDGQDLQPASDDYFHAISLQEIFTQTVTGSSKPVLSCSGDATACCGQAPGASGENLPPTVSAGEPKSVPAQTPLWLTASATDSVDAATLTYCWEEFDLGTAAPPHTDDGSRPLFRSRLPVAGASKSFPSLQYVLNNANVPPETYTVEGNTKTFLTGENLATTDRKLKFRVSVRDNRATSDAVGGAVGFADVEHTVVAAAGPFRVTQPNAQASWPGGSQQTIKWDVARTNEAPISCPNVEIALTTDAGATFAVVAASTANDGDESIAVPQVSTSTGRIRVKCVDNVFYDLSDADIAISSNPNLLIAAFTFAPTAPQPGEAVQFTDTSSGGPTAWSWNFGDGSSSSDPNPSHTYPNAGVYLVRLTVTGAENVTSTIGKALRVGSATGEYIPRLAVPGQARAAGANNSLFKTSFWITNPTSAPIDGQLRYVPAGGQTGGGGRETQLFIVAPGASLAYADVLSEAFGVTENTSGVIVVELPTNSGMPLVTSRTYNDAGSSGTFGQYIPAVAIPPVVRSGNEAWIFGLGGDDRNRSNVGVVNVTGAEITATLSVYDPTGVKVGNDLSFTVGAYSAVQKNKLNEQAGAGSLAVFSAKISATGLFFAYSSKLDNKTSDPIFVPGTLSARSQQWLDGLASASGVGGTFFRSNLSLTNPGSGTVEVMAMLRRRGATDVAGTATISLGAGESKYWNDAIQELFAVTEFPGQIELMGGPVVAWARTYNDRGESGTFGQFIPAFDAGDLIGSSGAILQGLSESSAFRTNMGFVNTSDAEIQVTVTAYRGDGAEAGSKTFTVPARAASFYSRIFTQMGADGLTNGYAKIVPSAAGVAYAWASSVDNVSTDQTFFRPLLLP